MRTQAYISKVRANRCNLLHNVNEVDVNRYVLEVTSLIEVASKYGRMSLQTPYFPSDEAATAIKVHFDDLGYEVIKCGKGESRFLCINWGNVNE